MCMWLCLFQRDAQLFRAMEHAHQARLWFPTGGQERRKVPQRRAKGQQAKEQKNKIKSQLHPPKEYMPKLAKKKKHQLGGREIGLKRGCG